MCDSSGLADLPRAWGGPCLSATLRETPEDFEVTEIAQTEPDGKGDHLWLWVQKRGCNTVWVAQQLAAWLGVRSSAVAYAGLKDRHALTRQWFSVKLSQGVEVDGVHNELECPIKDVEILVARRHSRRLQRGELLGNRFRITLTEVGFTGQGRDAVEHCLTQILRHGVPNYFGPQRFGHEEGNLRRAERLFAGQEPGDRQQRGMAISAARSWLFNQLLAQRVSMRDELASWLQALPGEVLVDRNSGGEYLSHLLGASQPPGLQLEPSGPMWGVGPLPARKQCAELEQGVAREWSVLSAGLEALGLRQQRRLLRLPVESLSWRWLESGADSDTRMVLRFELPKGAYATAVLRELMDLSPA